MRYNKYTPDNNVVDCQFPQGLGDLDTAVTHYRDVLKSDSTCVEAIACIATHHFYSDQPELALRFYRYGKIWTNSYNIL